MKIHIDYIPLEEYIANEPDRFDKVEDGLFHLAMRRTSGRGAEALVAPVFVKLLPRQLARAAFTVTFTDKDLNPAHSKGLESELVDGYWKPAKEMKLRGKNVDGQSGTGYFMPYSDELDLDMLSALSELDQDMFV